MRTTDFARAFEAEPRPRVAAWVACRVHSDGKPNPSSPEKPTWTSSRRFSPMTCRWLAPVRVIARFSGPLRVETPRAKRDPSKVSLKCWIFVKRSGGLKKGGRRDCGDSVDQSLAFVSSSLSAESARFRSRRSAMSRPQVSGSPICLYKSLTLRKKRQASW